MNMHKVIFGTLILLAMTLNFGFFLGDMDKPTHHDSYELFAALLFSLIATWLKLNDRSYIGSVFLATSLVADLHLFLASGIWIWAHTLSQAELISYTPTVVSLSAGALLANIISVVLLVVDTIETKR